MQPCSFGAWWTETLATIGVRAHYSIVPMQCGRVNPCTPFDARGDVWLAICHMAVKSVSRATGRSAVAAAAYRSADTLTNERDGVTHRYEKRRGVDAAFIVAPVGCEWAQDRSRLWNAAEAAERRKDAKVAREYEIALPHELTATQREALARQFASALVERFGVAADVAIHAPGREGDRRNHHAHILTTTRAVEPDGLGAKTRQLDVSSSAAQEIEALRELWARQCNEALERHQHAARLDPRSYAAQGLERVPGVHLGPTATAIERREVRTAEKEGRTYQPRTHEAKMNAERQRLSAEIIDIKAEREKREEAIRAAQKAQERSKPPQDTRSPEDRQRAAIAARVLAADPARTKKVDAVRKVLGGLSPDKLEERRRSIFEQQREAERALHWLKGDPQHMHNSRNPAARAVEKAWSDQNRAGDYLRMANRDLADWQKAHPIKAKILGDPNRLLRAINDAEDRLTACQAELKAAKERLAPEIKEAERKAFLAKYTTEAATALQGEREAIRKAIVKEMPRSPEAVREREAEGKHREQLEHERQRKRDRDRGRGR